MSRPMKITFQCPVCSDKASGLGIIKPAIFKPSVKHHNCATCECKFKLVLSRPKHPTSKLQCDINIFLLEVGEFAKINFSDKLPKEVSNEHTSP